MTSRPEAPAAFPKAAFQEAAPLERVTTSVEATEALGTALGAAARAAWPAPGPVLLLDGPLGAGKTAFVRGLARGLGLAAPVKSPTFALHLGYPGAPGLQHLDLYRLRGGAELDELGLGDLLAAPDVVAIEWPDRLGAEAPTPEALPGRLVRLRFLPEESDRRRLVVEAAEPWRTVLAGAPASAAGAAAPSPDPSRPDARPGH